MSELVCIDCAALGEECPALTVRDVVMDVAAFMGEHYPEPPATAAELAAVAEYHRVAAQSLEDVLPLLRERHPEAVDTLANAESAAGFYRRSAATFDEIAGGMA
jgi:hypothetical protein